MQFQNQKKTFLAKLDKSRKGKIDKPIKSLINKINKSKNYYSTSSCSGRIVLLAKNQGEKQGAKWLFTSHKKTNLKQIKSALKNLPKTNVYFRFEPLILHIASDTIENAQKLVNKARSIGFKRTGIQSTKNKIITEIASTEILNTIIAKNKKLLITNDYLKVLIQEANKKLEQNNKKIRKFLKSITSC
jgi:tRNA wybutosine-synthesizing protein 3